MTAGCATAKQPGPLSAAVAFALAFLVAAAAPVRAAEVRANEVEKHYSISGTTGFELYESIGARGPLIRDGASRAVAITEFDLKWGRDYVRDGNDCVLAAARSFLTITYTYPKPAQTLPPDVAARWRVFIEGIRVHEAVHGRYVLEMAQQIYDTTVGFRQKNDPGCKTIRSAIQTPLKAAFDRYKARNRAFEEAEMRDGGNVHRLILQLVNGP
ncbi:MAG: DUF922 domain-containing protein [Pseudomonadota bacterium]